MTRKDYVALAEAIKGEFPVEITNSELLRTRIADWRGMVAAIANVCARDNSRFDRERFERACEGYRLPWGDQ